MTKEKTIRYANVNYWIDLKEKKNRSYHYHLKKLNKIKGELKSLKNNL